MKSIFDMTGSEKAAALIVLLGPDIAAEIIKNLDEDSIKVIAGEIAKIGQLMPDDREELIGEFMITLRKTRGTLFGGENVARELLTAALGQDKAGQVFKNLSKRDLAKGFDYLNEIDTGFLVNFFQNEHPQTITVALAYLKPAKAAGILKALPTTTARDVVKRMAKMDKTLPEAVIEISRIIRAKYEKHKEAGSGFESAGGLDTLVSIMNHMNGQQEKMLMDHFDHAMPGISREIRGRIFTFDNILTLTNQEVRVLVDTVNNDFIIARALKGAGDEIRFKLLRNMSANRATDILRDVNDLGPLRLGEIQKARDDIVAVMKRLHDEGTISLRKVKEQYVE